MREGGRFGFWTLVFLVIANMVGAGVFTTSGFTLRELGTPERVVAAWTMGGLIALAGAYSYGRLIQAMPESGGEYLFLSRAFHPMLGFVAGWVSLIAGFTGAIAFAATAFESYALPEAARPAWLPPDALAIASILMCAAFHGFRSRVGTLFQNGVVILKLGLIAAFLMLAASQIPADIWQGGPVPVEGDSGTWGMLAAFAGSLVWISLSYSGFNAAVYVAEEAHETRRTIPRALLAGTTAVTLLYILLNAVFVFGPPPESISGKADVAAVAAGWIGGAPVALLFRSMVSLALFTSVSSMMMAAPRVYAKMAEDGLMPQQLVFTGAAPKAAVGLQAMLAGLFVLVSSLQGLLSYLGLTLSLCAALSVACLFLPTVRREPWLHPTHWPPLCYVAATILCASMMAADNPSQILGTAVTFAVGGGVYLMWGRTRFKPGERNAGGRSFNG